MKKVLYLLSAAIVIGTTASAQIYTTSSPNLLGIYGYPNPSGGIGGPEIYLNRDNNGTDGGAISIMSGAGSSSNGSNSPTSAAFQFSTSGWVPRFRVFKNGLFQIEQTDNGYAALKFNTPNWATISAGQNGSEIMLESIGTGTGNINGGITLLAYNHTSAPQDERAFEFATKNASTIGGSISYNSHLTVRKNGKVVIGDGLNYQSLTNLAKVPDGYKLYVEQGILTEKIKVASMSGGSWADFVFDESYSLKSLNEVETFIKENKHLPEIPSAKEVEANGFELAQMDAKLLQKIEELTLYVIQQQKEINTLKAQQSRK